MIDLKLVQKQPEVLAKALADRQSPLKVDEFLELDGRRRALLAEVESLKQQQNAASRQVAQIKREGGDASHMMEELGALSARIKALDVQTAEAKAAVENWLMGVPNIPDASVPVGKYNTSEFTLAELINDADNLAANFKAYLQSFSPNVQEIIVSAEKGLDFYKQIDKMDKNDRLLSVVKAFSELDLNPRTIDNVKMGYIFEDLIRRFSENAEAGDHYTGRDIIKLMVNILLAEGCDDIFDDGKVITVLDQACGTGGMLSTSYNFIKRYNPTADVRLFGQEINPESYAICLAEMLIKGQSRSPERAPAWSWRTRG